MDNLEIYNRLRGVPENAQKTIKGGRLNGFTDISPMWRIKMLTEVFGVCGIGWKYEIEKCWTETSSTGEIAAFVNIVLFIKHNSEWSEGIPGTGGSKLVAQESARLYFSDEAYKMALTDAIGVACKALGMGADIYWEKDKSKYDAPPEQKSTSKYKNLEPKSESKKDGTAPKELSKAGQMEKQIHNINEAIRKNELDKLEVTEVLKPFGIASVEELRSEIYPSIVAAFKDYVARKKRGE